LKVLGGFGIGFVVNGVWDGVWGLGCRAPSFQKSHAALPKDLVRSAYKIAQYNSLSVHCMPCTYNHAMHQYGLVVTRTDW